MSNNNNNRNSVVIYGKRYNINTTTRLDLFRINLTKLPENIGQLTKLKVLSLYDNKLTKLPESIGNLTKLRVLNLRDNELTSLPESIGDLTKLEYVNLEYNNLEFLPESFGNLKNLKILYLSGNNLTSLPESIGNLKDLSILELKNNKLTSLPESFKNLNGELHIKYNNNNYTRNKFVRLFRPNRPNISKRISKNTELFNRTISKTNKIFNIPKNKRVYINTNSNIKNNGELRRLYNNNGINRYMRGRNTGRLHGGNFRMSNVKKLTNTNIVNKNVYLRNIKFRLQNSSLNNFNQIVERIKTNLPSNVNKIEVNKIVRKMKPQLSQKIFNKLRTTPPNNRLRVMNTMKNVGLMNNSDINIMKKKLNNVR
jgi:Leucine-rich repeat (LRR) protein